MITPITIALSDPFIAQPPGVWVEATACVPVAGGAAAGGTEGDAVAVGGVGTASNAATIRKTVGLEECGSQAAASSEPPELSELPEEPELESVPPRAGSLTFEESSPTRVTPSMS
jgi:hypothetical protein